MTQARLLFVPKLCHEEVKKQNKQVGGENNELSRSDVEVETPESHFW